MYYSTSRVLAVLELLQTHGLMRGDDIAARLEVDVRTVRRYVLILRERGVPIEMRRGRHGGYSLAPGYRAPLALTKDEALALAYGLLSVEPRALSVTDGDGKRALRKVARALPAMTRDLIQGMDGAVTFATPMMGGETLAVPALLETASRDSHAEPAGHSPSRARWRGDRARGRSLSGRPPLRTLVSGGLLPSSERSARLQARSHYQCQCARGYLHADAG